jgi:hypothetical protein
MNAPLALDSLASIKHASSLGLATHVNAMAQVLSIAVDVDRIWINEQDSARQLSLQLHHPDIIESVVALSQAGD